MCGCVCMCGCFGNMCTCIYCSVLCFFSVSFMYIYSYLFCLYCCKDCCHRVTTELQLVVVVVVVAVVIIIIIIISQIFVHISARRLLIIPGHHGVPQVLLSIPNYLQRAATCFFKIVYNYLQTTLPLHYCNMSY
jgi:hypothetical protein